MNVDGCRDGSAKNHTNMDGSVQTTQRTTEVTPYLHHFFISVIRTKYKRERMKQEWGREGPRTWRGRDRRMSVRKKGGRGGICY